MTLAMTPAAAALISLAPLHQSSRQKHMCPLPLLSIMQPTSSSPNARRSMCIWSVQRRPTTVSSSPASSTNGAAPAALHLRRRPGVEPVVVAARVGATVAGEAGDLVAVRHALVGLHLRGEEGGGGDETGEQDGVRSHR